MIDKQQNNSLQLNIRYKKGNLMLPLISGDGDN